MFCPCRGHLQPHPPFSIDLLGSEACPWSVIPRQDRWEQSKEEASGQKSPPNPHPALLQRGSLGAVAWETRASLEKLEDPVSVRGAVSHRPQLLLLHIAPRHTNPFIPS